jgi:hypothetical protein
MRHDIALRSLSDHPRYLALVRYLEGEAPATPPARAMENGAANP